MGGLCAAVGGCNRGACRTGLVGRGPEVGEVVQIRDFHLKRLEKEASKVLAQVIDYSEVARLGGPGGVDDLVILGAEPYDGKEPA
jgi:NTP pyrophosphatase (non-canonical NTP hydrolase)